MGAAAQGLVSLILTEWLWVGAAAAAAAQEVGDEWPYDDWLQSVKLNRHFVKEGFHREIVTDVEFGASVSSDCCVMVKEQLPQGLYVDPYELASHQEHNKTEVLVLDVIDIEAPEYLSTVHSILIYLKPHSRRADYFTATVPVHIRYHRPTSMGDTVTLVTLADPELMVHCERSLVHEGGFKLALTKAPCSVSNHSICNWINVNYQTVTSTLSLQVPVGQTHHIVAVSTVTLLTTVLCCSLLIKTVWTYGEFEYSIQR
ncbi:phosphatidylinositol-glycan biosynthesis class X protein isoform X1 [Callorhinchus milii]|uniref:phosphatidylinositol-glycan biosynthesis class X protein isoform X1 n=1 Tax=Callorhinchus milii TaxID=7868 RepID=UPI0004574229|nr:phosphatidylinositol-glycan biosynthesis class X protein isoform X1 [Callorhinchus milii]|eukprot:gi/632934512/ref/XP_007885238.1/ PREDICTED: phosphatidylinositol-glycan biosynthesis class X protein [Callorhinchus milii]